MMFEQTDCASADVAARLSACLDMQTGENLPPLWHWLLFLDPAPASALGPDGHRASGGPVPLDPDLPARMWAGGNVQFHKPIPIGTILRRATRVADITERQGRSGKLRFVTLQHTIFSNDDLLIEERQNLVYRAAIAPRPQAAPAHAAPPGAFLRSITPDEIMLFRFSALTFNAHRIHYDLPYATTVEHYPGLVVHGPLQAILLAGHLANAMPEGAVIHHFDYRGLAPAFGGRPLNLEAWPAEAWPNADHPATWHLQTRDPAGAICMSAQAKTGHPP
jgi:3-methylfumaryl-CoA hydratase